MGTDARGLTVTCDAAAELAAIDDFAHRILRLTAGAEIVLVAAEMHADVPMLALDAAALYLFALTSEGDRAAAQYLDRAAVLKPRKLPREAQLDAALRAWHRHDFSAAAASSCASRGSMRGFSMAARSKYWAATRSPSEVSAKR